MTGYKSKRAAAQDKLESMEREALKLALDAILNFPDDISDEMFKAIASIKEALAQPEREPFAYVNVEKRRLEFAHDYVKWDTPTTIKLDKIPLYTTPPQRPWVGLTEKDFSAINQSCLTKLQAAISAESILKEKNT